MQCVLELLISLAVLFAPDWRLATLTALLLPLLTAASRPLAARATAYTVRRRQAEADLTATVEESIQAQAIARAFSLEHWASARYAQQLGKCAPIATAAEFLEWLVCRVTCAGQYLIQLLVIAIGAYEAFRGAMSVGALAGTAALLYNVGWSISVVGMACADLIPGGASLQRIEQFMSEKSLVADAPGARTLSRLENEIRFERVGHGYDGANGPQALRAVNLALTAGQLVAFVDGRES